MKKSGRRFVIELLCTGLVSAIVLVVAMPVPGYVLWLGRRISGWIDSVFPPDRSGWFGGLAGSGLAVDTLLAWLNIWIVLLAVLRLLEKSEKRGNEQE
jgi:NADH:ubiquinone oxidoreductase subunit H